MGRVIGSTDKHSKQYFNITLLRCIFPINIKNSKVTVCLLRFHALSDFDDIWYRDRSRKSFEGVEIGYMIWNNCCGVVAGGSLWWLPAPLGDRRDSKNK